MKKSKKKLNILVTAGALREPIDPVRFISNRATGLLGCEIVRAAKDRGHRVFLISGLMLYPKPDGVGVADVETARQMYRELKARFNWCDCLIMTAAVSDFRVGKIAKRKIKRSAKEKLVLRLRRNPDILGSLGRRKGEKVLVGFSLETENLRQNAQTKLREKNLDFIVATQTSNNGSPFGASKLKALIIDRKEDIQRVGRTTKKRLARILVEKIETLAA